MLVSWKKTYDKLSSVLKSRDITLPTKVYIVQAMIFFSSHVWMWELDCKNGWVLKNWCFWTVMLEKTLESPLDSKEIKPVNPKGYEYSLEGLLLKLKLQYFGHLMWRADSLEKILMMAKIEDRRKSVTEKEMIGWHHWLDGHEFEQTPGDGDGPGSLACCSPWGHKELDMTEQLNSNKLLPLRMRLCVLCLVYQSCLTPWTVAHRLHHP